MSYTLQRLKNAWAVDQSIVTDESNLVVIRFGNSSSTDCLRMDETLSKIADSVSRFARIYTCDTTRVKDFNEMYELYDDLNLMFFYRNKHMMIDLGTGDNNKITFPIENKQQLIDIFEVLYRGAIKGKGLVVGPTDFTFRY